MLYLTLRRAEDPTRRVSWDFFSSLLTRTRSPDPQRPLLVPPTRNLQEVLSVPPPPSGDYSSPKEHYDLDATSAKPLPLRDSSRRSLSYKSSENRLAATSQFS
jgi:hypothetical protein